MNPRLIAISGPLEGQTFSLEGERFRVGRGGDNDLQIKSVEVSRHHCELRCRVDSGFSIVDLDSRHGVFVNGRPVRERALAHSDLVSIGSTALLFLLDDSAPERHATPTTRSDWQAGSTIARDATELLSVDRARLEAALPAQARIGRDLHALLQASTRLQQTLEPAELGRRLVDAVREVVPGERFAVLLAEAGSDELLPLAAAAGREPTPPDAVVPEPQAIAQMRAQRAALWIEGAGDAGALLLVPMLDHDGRILGVVYAESSRPQAFDEGHLELLGALGGIASLAFQNALHAGRLQSENRRLRAHQLQHELIGESPPIQRLLGLIARVAASESTVLIHGESGTGKELVAQAIHRSSARREGPFVAVNCATFSETLIESELFGHEKGAFTGAVTRAIGKFETAAGGTLFLDEVGEIPTGLQAKLLRVLQEREFVRVGGTRPIAADVRLLAATNRDLEAAVAERSFREDLYYRLKVIKLALPPLRERQGDVVLLARHFLALHGRRMGRTGITLSPAARRCLLAYPWPGNVRELSNVIERALVLGDTEVVQPEDLPDEVVEGSAEIPSSFQAALHELKTRLVVDAYREAGGDYAGAAAILGVHVNSLHRMIRRLGIKQRLEA